MTQVLWFLWLLPRNICVLILRGYRAGISPLYGDVCRYYPSCSAYALTAIQRHGVVRGVLLGSWRIARCHPWASGGIDDVPAARGERYVVTGFGFVVARGLRSQTTSREVQVPRRWDRLQTAHSHGKG